MLDGEIEQVEQGRLVLHAVDVIEGDGLRRGLGERRERRQIGGVRTKRPYPLGEDRQ